MSDTPNPAASPSSAPAPVAAAPVAAPPISAPAPVAFQPKQSYVYDMTGDAGMDLFLTHAGEAGLGPDHPAMVAAAKGDFSVAMPLLGGTATGKAAVSLAETYVRNAASRAAAAQAAATEAIHKAVAKDGVDGKARWAAVQEWVKEKADPAEKASINAVLAQGGYAAKLLAQSLAQRYDASNPPREGKRAADPSLGGGPAPVTDNVLSAEQYKNELNRLHRQYPGRNTEELPGYRELSKRYMAGRLRR